MVTGEISSIYKWDGRVRKVHSLILLPGLEEAEALALRLEQVGNLHSDGRPILGLDARDLLEITLDVCPRAMFIPAHIWTPHFSLFGANSGFDRIEDCFRDLTPHIHALETGLSSDPPHELAAFRPGQVYPGVPFRRPFPRQAGAGGGFVYLRDDLSGHQTGPGKQGGRRLRGYPGVFPRGGEIPRRRPPELRGLFDPGRNRAGGGPLSRLR